MLPFDKTPRISWVSGVVHGGDAISETLLAELAALDRLCRRERFNIDAQVFCNSSSVGDARIRVLGDWRNMLADEHFQTSDVYIFHFGVYADIHHALNFIRRDAVVIVWFHNITPPQFAAAASEDLIFKSYQQAGNFAVADLVLVNSQHTAESLHRFNLPVPVEVVRLFGPNVDSARARQAQAEVRELGAPARMLYCGRFVEAKSAHTLLEAMALVGAGSPYEFRITLAGLRDYSDPSYIARLERLAKALPASVEVEFVFDSPSSVLQALFAQSDVFVLPSLHEGFGMPVVESLAAGTPVVSTRAGALEEIAGGLALHFDASDAAGLAERITAWLAARSRGQVLCALGELPYSAWRVRAADWAGSYSREQYVEQTTERLHGWLKRRPLASKSRIEALTRVHAESNLYAPFASPADTREAALKAAVLGEEVVSRFRVSAEAGYTRLLSWPFPGVGQSPADIAYWRNRVAETGFRSVLLHLADAPDVRVDAERLQMSTFLTSTVIAAQVGIDPAPAAAADPAVGWEMRLRLLAQAQISDSEFVREAYRLILERESEEGGLGAYFHSLQAGTMTRVQVIDEIAGSTEARSLRARKAKAGG